jgi:hypothetical protein
LVNKAVIFGDEDLVMLYDHDIMMKERADSCSNTSVKRFLQVSLPSLAGGFIKIYWISCMMLTIYCTNN